MQHVNIYIQTTIKGPRKQDGYYCFLLELEGNPNTLDGFGTLKMLNEQQSQIHTLTVALKHMRKPCILSIYADSAYLDKVFNRGWLAKWQENGWKTSRNRPVSDREELEEMLKMLNTHEFSITTTSHAFSEWMAMGLKKMEEKK